MVETRKSSDQELFHIAGKENNESGAPGKERAGAVLIIVLLAFCSPLGDRFPLIVQNVSIASVIVAAVLLLTLSWWRLSKACRDKTAARWRVRVSLCGCIALLLAVGIPFCVAIFGLSRGSMSRWCLAFGLGSMLAAVLGGKTMRFPVFFGGLIVASLVMLIPAGLM